MFYLYSCSPCVCSSYQAWCHRYLTSLEKLDRFKHTIWPTHCIIGSKGHSVVPVLQQALQDWEEVSGKSVFYVMKGMNIRTEMYSVMAAEVEDPEDATTGLNEELLGMLRICDKVHFVFLLSLFS